MQVFSDQLFVSRNDRGDYRGMMGREAAGNSGVGDAKARWGRGVGEGNRGGSTEGTSSTSKNRLLQHKYKSSKQFE